MNFSYSSPRATIWQRKGARLCLHNPSSLYPRVAGHFTCAKGVCHFQCDICLAPPGSRRNPITPGSSPARAIGSGTRNTVTWSRAMTWRIVGSRIGQVQYLRVHPYPLSPPLSLLSKSKGGSSLKRGDKHVSREGKGWNVDALIL